MTSHLPTRSAGRFSIVILAALVAASFARGQTHVAMLDRYVVSASRTAQDPKFAASSVSLLPLDELADEQIGNLNAALAQQPGVTLHSAGGAGSQSTVFLRGASGHQTLVIVDGVRMSDRSAAYQNFLGGADLAGLDRVEVLRGPQSTLYGSSAMGGVILIDTSRGAGPAAGSLSAIAGSFESFGAAATVAGAQGAIDYSAAVSRYQTANDRAENDFDQWSGSARVDYSAARNLLVGATFRAISSTYHEPGSRMFPFAGTVDFKNYLTTVYGDVRLGDGLTSRITLAEHVRDYLYGSAYGSTPLRNTRKILDWQNTWEATARAQIVAGANVENSRYVISGTPSSDRVTAGYVSAIVRPTDEVTLTAGVRRDDFKSVGGATTGRAGATWRPAATTKLRATYGTGFSAPGSDDVYGVPSYGQLPSPGLLPEKSHGWDAGVDQDFLSGAATASVTYFKNEFSNLFEYETVDWTTYEGRVVNRAHASTEGVEVALVGRPTTAVTARAAYTYLEARNDDTGARLTRRPRHVGDLEVTARVTKAWIIGAGAHLVASRLEGATPIEDYTTVRVFTSYAVRPELVLKLRVENAFDEHYEEVFGYPALPRGVFGSVEWRF